MNKQAKIILETRILDETSGEWLVPVGAVERMLIELELDLPNYSPEPEVTEGMVIRALRREKDLKQNYVEGAAGMPYGSLAKLEKTAKGATMKTIMNILKVMNLSLSDYDRKYIELLNYNYETS